MCFIGLKPAEANSFACSRLVISAMYKGIKSQILNAVGP